MSRKISEGQIRKQLIDASIAKHLAHRLQLEGAGWYLRKHSKVKIEIPKIVSPLNLQEEFAGVVARALCRACRDIESLRGRMGESTRQVEGLFESLLAQSFDGG
jgi:hypothetical protein